MDYPFIYICSLMRTGSTILQETLTDTPYSLILSEPRFNAINFVLNDGNTQQLVRAGIKSPNTSNVKHFFEDMGRDIYQVGVKEIRNKGWKGYLNAFEGNIKVLLTARDPRDIYISAAGVLQRNNSWTPVFGFTPKGIYNEVIGEFKIQRELYNFGLSIKIKYEDLCVNFNNEYARIKEFVNSPIPDVGEVGEFHRNISAGLHETLTHAGQVTTKRTEIWKRESNIKLLNEANIFFKLMSDYNDFWGYE